MNTTNTTTGAAGANTTTGAAGANTTQIMPDMNHLTPAQKLERAHVKLIQHKSTMLYAGIVMLGNTSLDDSITTAVTNGFDVRYSPEFITQLTDPELVGLVLHEVLHKAYQQLWLWRHLWREDARLANQAADYCINGEIMILASLYPAFIALPEVALYNPDFAGMDTGQIFKLLQRQGQPPTNTTNTNQHHQHHQHLDEHDYESAGQQSEEVAQNVARDIDQALRQGLVMAAKLGADSSRAILDLLKPVVDWREQLRDFITTVTAGSGNSTWRRPNRRWIGEGLYLPSQVTETLGCLVVGIDTSCSIGDRELASFLSEIVGICEQVNPDLIHVIECDAKIQNHETYTAETAYQIKDKTSFKGGGGTDLRKIFGYIDKQDLKPEVIVVLTDGETPFPDTLKFPTIWALVGTTASAPCGSSVFIDGESG